MNRRVLRHKILYWLLRVTRPFGLEVQVVRVQARPDFTAEISRWTADEFGDPKGAVDAFLVLAPTAERTPPERPSEAVQCTGRKREAEANGPGI